MNWTHSVFSLTQPDTEAGVHGQTERTECSVWYKYIPEGTALRTFLEARHLPICIHM